MERGKPWSVRITISTAVTYDVEASDKGSAIELAKDRMRSELLNGDFRISESDVTDIKVEGEN